MGLFQRLWLGKKRVEVTDEQTRTQETCLERVDVNVLTDDEKIRQCYQTKYNELLVRAGRIFIDNTREELQQYSFQVLLRIIKIEESDRSRGVTPSTRITSVHVTDEEWRM